MNNVSLFLVIAKVNFVVLTKMALNDWFWRHMQTKSSENELSYSNTCCNAMFYSVSY